MKISIVMEALTGRFETDTKRASRNFDRRMRNMRRQARVAGRQIGIALAAGAALVAVGVRKIIAATDEQEASVAQLNASLRSTGRFTEENSKALREHAAALQRVTAFGDEAIISAQSQLLTFTQLGTEVFPRATAAVLDLSTKMGTDLRSSVVQIGKALNDPILGVTALARSGIQFTEQQKEMIRTLVESGKILDAQKIILKELETQFGGSAEAARNTLGGALKGLSNAFGDLLEGESGSAGMQGAIKAFNDLSETLNDPATKEGFARLTESIVNFIGKMAQVPSSIIFLKDEIKELFGVIEDHDFDRREDEIADLESKLIKAREKSINIFGRENKMFAAHARNLEIEIRLKKESLELDRLASAVKKKEPNVPALLDLPTPTIETIINPDEEKRLEKIRSQLDGMFQQVREFGKTAEEKALLQLIDLGATEDEIAQAMLLLDEVRILGEEEKRREDAIKTRNDLEREYASLVESLQTPTEDHVAQINRIAELYAAGIIPSVEEYAEAINRTTQRFEEAGKKTEELDEFAQQAARNIQSHFADFLFDPFDEGIKGMLDGFITTLRRMAAEAAAAAILRQLFGGDGHTGAFGSGGFGDFLGSIFGGSRDSGGRGYPGHAYLINPKAGPELFIPDSPGRFYPNANEMGGQTIQNTFILPPQPVPKTPSQLAYEMNQRQQIALVRNR